nr:MAG TPA: hypothetical protein [Caudoviricetes sp.]
MSIGHRKNFFIGENFRKNSFLTKKVQFFNKIIKKKFSFK